MCWCRNGSYPGRKISLRDLPLRKPAFVLRQRFLCLRRWMRSWHPCYSRTVSTEQTATTWGLLLVVQTSSRMMFLEYASMHPCMPMPHGFISSYPSIYHTALGPAHRYTRLRGRLAVLIWNPHGQWFEGFELTLDSSGNICNVFRLHPTISIHVADLNRHIVVIYMLQIPEDRCDLFSEISSSSLSNASEILCR